MFLKCICTPLRIELGEREFDQMEFFSLSSLLKDNCLKEYECSHPVTNA